MPVNVNELVAQGGGFEPQRQNNFRLLLRKPFAGDALSGSEFWLALRSMPIPAESNARKTLRWFNESRFYAGSVEDFSSIQLRIRDFLDVDIVKRLYDWRRTVWDPNTSSIGLARNYKGTGILYLLPPGNDAENPAIDHGGNPGANSRAMFLQGVWPMSLDYGEVSLDNDGDEIEVTFELSIDRAYPGSADGTADTEAMNAVFPA